MPCLSPVGNCPGGKRDGGRHPKSCSDQPDGRAWVRHWGRLTRGAKGLIGETVAAAWLVAHGFDVWRPLAPQHRADLAVRRGRRLVRIQVRVAAYSVTRRTYRVGLRRRADRRLVPYTRRDIDFVLTVCPTPSGPVVYVFPSRVIAGRATATLAPHRRNGPAGRWEAYREAGRLLARAEV